MFFNFIKKTVVLSRLTVLKLIKIYQKTISFDHGLFAFLFPYGYCRFKPTCSEYAYQAVAKYGIIKGGLKAIWRVLRCNPFGKGGYDPVDKKEDDDEDQSWFWSKEWQESEKRADEDLKAGRYTEYDSVEDFIKSLNNNHK